MALVLKVYLGQEIHRISVDEEPKNYEDLCKLIKMMVKSFNKSWRVKYYDEEKDLVSIASDIEYVEALKIARSCGNILRIHLLESKKPLQKQISLEKISKFSEKVQKEIEEFFTDLAKSEPIEKIQQFIQSLFEKAKIPTPAPESQIPEVEIVAPVPENLETPSIPSLKDTPLPETPSPLKQIVYPSRPSARFLDDVTVRPGTEFRMGEKFVKIWKFRNEGVETWPEGCQFSYVQGDHFYLEDCVPVPALKPLEEWEVAVNMMAPAEPGTYKNFWRLIYNRARFGPRVCCEIVVTAESISSSEFSEESAIQQLVDMGFSDIPLLKELLSAENNDVNKVLAHLFNA